MNKINFVKRWFSTHIENHMTLIEMLLQNLNRERNCCKFIQVIFLILCLKWKLRDFQRKAFSFTMCTIYLNRCLHLKISMCFYHNYNEQNFLTFILVLYLYTSHLTDILSSLLYISQKSLVRMRKSCKNLFLSCFYAHHIG